MIGRPTTTELLSAKRAREQQREETRRRIDRDIDAMKETSIRTRELIIECRKAMRRLDQFFKWH
jgi:hypothetical protein